MIKWIKDIKWMKVLLVGLIYTVLATVIHEAEAILTMKYYFMPQYFGVWSKLMMPRAGSPPPEFFTTSLVLTFISGISLTLIYYYIRNQLPKSFWKKVLFFADLMIAASFIFFTLPSYLMFNLPWQLLASWFISSFIILVTAAFTIVKIIS